MSSVTRASVLSVTRACVSSVTQACVSSGLTAGSSASVRVTQPGLADGWYLDECGPVVR